MATGRLAWGEETVLPDRDRRARTSQDLYWISSIAFPREGSMVARGGSLQTEAWGFRFGSREACRFAFAPPLAGAAPSRRSCLAGASRWRQPTPRRVEFATPRRQWRS